MGFASGPVSFQRFFIDGKLPHEVNDAFVAALNGQTFGRKPPAADDTQIGWTGPQHLFATELAAEQLMYGPFAYLAVRLDKLRPPASVVKAYTLLEEETALAASGREFLSKSERRQAREAARMRADQEARSGAFRRMSHTPTLIDLKQRVLYLGGGSASLGDKVLQLFYDTFGCTLTPADPEQLAGRIAQRSGLLRSLENVAPMTLVNPPDDQAAGGDFSGELSFLGKELLTWLWYQAEAQHAMLKIRQDDQVTVMLDKTLRLKCDFGLTGVTTIAADNPTSLPEAHAALRIGKQPTRVGLVVGTGVGEFRLTLDGPRLAVSGLVLPDPDAPRSPREVLEQRFEQIVDTATIVDALYELFLDRRLARDWERELHALANWAAGKQATRAQALPA